MLSTADFGPDANAKHGQRFLEYDLVTKVEHCGLPSHSK